MTRPNILLIMADQLAPHFVGAYGDPVAITPHMDALAARGMRFDAAYCNSPLCAPSRASFMAGQLVSRVRAYDNAAEMRASIPTFAHYLRALDYHTCLSGKMHFVGPDQKHGFEDRVTTDIYPADFAWTPDWENADDRIDSWYHNMAVVKEAGTAVATFQTDFDDETEWEARRWLIDWGRDKGAGATRPFAMVASFMHPHDPYVAKPEFWDMYDEIDIPMPALPEVATDPHSQRLRDGIEATTTPVSDDEIYAARRAYYANVTYFDSKVGALMKTLEDMGELDNTIVILTADHGDMLGERGLWYKMSFFEHSVRVPLLMAGPGVAQGAVGNACSLVDLLPTMVEIADGGTDMFGAPVDGRSLMPLARGEDDPTDEAIAEYCAEMVPWPLLMIRRGPLKYIHCEVDPPQLYDVVADPMETRNLVDDPTYADQAAAFAAEVADRWESSALRDDVIATQKERFAVLKVTDSKADSWDYAPPRDASEAYVRNHMFWHEADARYRFPPLDKG